MILQALAECYEQLARENKVGRDGWSTAKVSYAITIDEEGNFKGIQSLMVQEARGKKQVLVSVSREVPLQKGRTIKISPNFMCDNAKYLLGAWLDSGTEDETEKNKRKAQEYFQAASEYHQKLLGTIDSKEAKSICLFFQKWDFEQYRDKIGISIEDLLAAANLVFRSYETADELQKNERIMEAWNRYCQDNQEGEKKRCLVTGQVAPVARLHPLIKGVRGAQSSGAALVSFNAPAFESYGKSQGANAPVSEYAAAAYGKALNYLLEKKEFYQSIGDTTMVYWADTGEEEYSNFFLELLGEAEESDEDKLIDVMQSIAKGNPCRYKESDMNPDTKFYILGLSPNAARLSVRFFYAGTFGNIIKNIESHYKRLEIQMPAFLKKKYPSARSILFETVNKKSSKKEIQPILTGGFMNAILSDTLYPKAIFTNIMIRIRADKEISRNRAAMIKAYIMKNIPQMKEAVNFMGLNEHSENVPYNLGRLFETLEEIQSEAYDKKDLNTTIKDKYFNSACATPAVVFPILLKLSNSHMRVLKREKTGKYVFLSERMAKLLGSFQEEFPKQLSLEEQGTFIVGYYHQLQKKFEKKNVENKEEK